MILIALAGLELYSARALLAASCQESLPIEERQLSVDEVRECLRPRAEIIVAFKLMDEKELSWKDYGEIRLKCTANGEVPLSDDPVVWAAQVSSCPSPKTECGCSKPDFAGSRFTPENSEASTVRDTNVALIKREGSLVTKEAFARCDAIRERLAAVPDAKIRRKCKGLH
jgi:hypothetical protein